MKRKQKRKKFPFWGICSLLLVLLMVFDIGILPFKTPKAVSLTSTFEAANAMPNVSYQGAKHPNWSQFSFADIQPSLQGGRIGFSDLNVSGISQSDIISELGYNPFRSWNQGDSISSILKLGDFQSTLADWSLNTVAGYSGLDLGGLRLSDFKMLRGLTVDDFMTAIPNLRFAKLSEVAPFFDVAKSVWGVNKALKLRNTPLGQLGNTVDFSNFSVLSTSDLSIDPLNLDLSNYSLLDIPGIENAAFGDFLNWKDNAIIDIPGLEFVPIVKFIFGVGNANFLGKVDLVLGDNEKKINNTISGSFQEGFNVNCDQDNCAHVELTKGFDWGVDGVSGKRWISGKSQKVKGGDGFLKWVAGGKEPTGRHPFGDLFKVVLLDTNEKEGKANFGIYFRFCFRALFFKGCSPYFIGPFPWFSHKEKDLIFLGTDGISFPTPSGVPINTIGIPQELLDDPRIQQAMAAEKDYGMTNYDASFSSDDCTSYKGVSLKPLTEAIAIQESRGSGDYEAVGVYVCADGGKNCGRALGRYQFMTYREDVVALISGKSGGLQWLEAIKRNQLSKEQIRQQIPYYFSPQEQEKLWSRWLTRLIDFGQRQGFKGDKLIQWVGTGHYSGEYCPRARTCNWAYGSKTVSLYKSQSLQVQAKAQCAIASTSEDLTQCPSSGILALRRPSNGVKTSGYGPRWGRMHRGVDYGAPIGSPIYAAADGKVINFYRNCPVNGVKGSDCGKQAGGSGFGNFIYIRHCNGWITRYAHLSPWSFNHLKKGSVVRTGEKIAEMGNSGSSTGPHLHFEVLVNNGKNRVDPEIYLR